MNKILLDFMTGLLLSKDKKYNDHDLIYIVIDYLIKIVDHQSINISFDKSNYANFIIDV